MTESDICKACKQVVGEVSSILCDFCNTWFHLPCSGLSKKSFCEILKAESSTWCCNFCLEELPFKNVDNEKLTDLLLPTRFSKRFKKLVNEINFNNTCNVCNKLVRNKIKSNPCFICKCLIHKKCSQLPIRKHSSNFFDSLKDWLCPSCKSNCFPFNNIDDNEMQKINQTNTKISEETISAKKLNEVYSEHFIDLESDKHCSFYDNKSFKKLIQNEISNKNFSILHTNISSINKNFEGLQIFLNSNNFKFDVISLTETWDSVAKLSDSSRFQLQGYHPYLGQQGKTMKSGCGFFISSQIKYIPRFDLDISFHDEVGKVEFECKWVELINKNKPNFVIGSIYRHPKKGDKTFINYLEEVMIKLEKESKTLFLSGDFNYNLLNHKNCDETSSFLDVMLTNHLLPTILLPTRIVPNANESLIDNIYTNSIDHSLISGNFVDKISDHMPNFLITQGFDKFIQKKKIKLRDFSNFDQKSFLIDLNKTGLATKISHVYEANEKFSIIHNHLIDVLNKHAPLKILSKNEAKLKLKPWVTKGILKSITLREKNHSKYLKNKDPFYYERYRIYRNKINHLLKDSKKLYFQKYFSDFKFDCKKMWNGINHILMKKKKEQNTINLLINNSIETDQTIVAEEFNTFYSNIGPELSKKIPKTKFNFEYFLKEPNPNCMYLSPITKDELSNIIRGLNKNKSSDIYDIPIKVVKMGESFFAEHLSTVFNFCFEQGVFPEYLKIAFISPIYKKDSKLFVGNYRPVSILPILSKIFEKVIVKRVLKFLSDNKIICENQFGFQSGKSTELAVLDLHKKLIDSIENKELACCVFLDLAKAFDTVDHKILLSKLEYYGFRGIVTTFFESYLQNRLQHVKLGDILSKPQTVLCGVPQGSVLGPILFLIYINDIIKCSSKLKFHIFADDASLLLSNESTENIEKEFNRELNNIKEWLNANKLTLNVDKTVFITFSPPQRKYSKICLKIGKKRIKEVNETKYLGVILDKHLSWKSHLETLNRKLSRGIGILYKLKQFATNEILRTSFFSFFQSHLNYNVLNWSCAYASNMKRIKTSLNKAVRILSPDKGTKVAFQDQKILDFESFKKFNYSRFMWKVYNKELPSSIENIFLSHSSDREQRNRFPGKKFVSIYRTYIRKGFSVIQLPLFGMNYQKILRF